MCGYLSVYLSSYSCLSIKVTPTFDFLLRLYFFQVWIYSDDHSTEWRTHAAISHGCGMPPCSPWTMEMLVGPSLFLTSTMLCVPLCVWNRFLEGGLPEPKVSGSTAWVLLFLLRVCSLHPYRIEDKATPYRLSTEAQHGTFGLFCQSDRWERAHRVLLCISLVVGVFE